MIIDMADDIFSDEWLDEYEKTHNINSEDAKFAISDIEDLTRKYGLDDDFSSIDETHINPVNPTETNIPKHTTPARVPKIVYDTENPDSAVRITHVRNGMTPDGRRVIYEENEDGITSGRLRNRRTPSVSEKGSNGFGSVPYVKHVASSQSAIKKDDASTFAKTYEQRVRSADRPITGIPVKQVSRVEKKAETPNKPTHVHYELTAKDKMKRFFKAFLPWKGDPAREVFRKLVMDISAVLILTCFGYFINNYVEHKKQLENQQNLQSVVTEQQVDDLAAQWAAIKAKYPDVNFPDGMNIKYAELYAKNQDLVGWLHIDNTNIDTAVVQKKSDIDNADSVEDFYLHHNFYGNQDKYGNAYLDKYNAGNTLDKNNVIYGHNMTDGLSFAQLEKYYKISGFKSSPVIQYNTIFNDYYFKVYAVFITNGYTAGDNGYLFNYNITGFGSEKNFEDFLATIDERKLYTTGVDITKDDTLITLSTCSYEIKTTDMGRLAVIGRLVRPGESTAVDTSLAVENPNPRYPQVWYNEHNISNPFANASQWRPE